MQTSHPSRRSLLSLAGGLAALMFSAVAAAQSDAPWPTRPVTIIVPGAPGGTIDIPIRLLAQKLGAQTGQPVIVDNRAGSGGIIGTQVALRAPANGYTLLAGNVGPQAINYSAYKHLSYQPSDLLPVTDVIAFPNVLVVNAQSPIKSVADLVAQMKQHPGELSFGSAGIGQTSHLAGELFKIRTGTDAIHVPYKGSTPATAALLAQETSFQFDNLTQALPHIRAGKLRALAVTDTQRAPSLPDVPTMEQAGFANLVSTAWIGIFVSAKTPPAVASQLEASLATVMRNPDLLAQLQQMGGVPGGRTPAQFDAFVASERDKWAEVIRASNLTLE
ncbi:MAG: tripartite tricarboxylate transporter substrate binding protein [Burkholderiaceae bacterium]|jgi:tripartite-type tricarboxylate transporter receptor subunit TctC|nr:tripartite tricarboxylate transporter substrate binding protein [Burkholderiaceae bacterium]